MNFISKEFLLTVTWKFPLGLPNQDTPYKSLIPETSSHTMSLVWDINADHATAQIAQLEERWKAAEAIRQKYLGVISRQLEHGTSVEDKLNKLERAAFVLGRPISNWRDFDLDFKPSELIDAFKIFITDGGTNYYTALLVTDKNYLKSQPVEVFRSSPLMSFVTKEYRIDVSVYFDYVYNRTFEPLFLLMNHVKGLDIYRELICNPGTPLLREQVNSYETGSTIYTTRIGTDENVISPPAPTPTPPPVVSGKRAREPVYSDQPPPVDATPPPPVKRSSGIKNLFASTS